MPVKYISLSVPIHIFHDFNLQVIGHLSRLNIEIYQYSQIELQCTCCAPHTWSVSAVEAVNTLLTHCIL